MPFNQQKVDRVIQFIGLLKHTKGKWAGKPFHLLDWQKKVITDVFGNVDSNGNRIIRKCYVEIPKKNGKSEFSAAIALYLLFADGEMGAEIYSAAADRDQASIVFNVAKQMILYNNTLYEKCRIMGSVKRIVVESTNSYYHVLSSDVKSKHGFNTHGVVFDELHAQPNRDLWDVLTEGAGDARQQPLIFAITTAGYDRESICWEVHEYADKVQRGIIQDPHFYSMIYGLDEKDDWEDEKNWQKVNPSVGVTIELEKIQAAYNEAKEIPAKQNVFRRLRLNQWTQQINRYIDMGVWDEQAGEVNEAELIGQKCFGGLDLSAVSDLTAWVLNFPVKDEETGVRVLCRFWCPEHKLYDKANKWQSQYQKWEQQGWLTTTPGNAIDYQFIKRAVMEDCERFNVVGINIDRLFQGYQLAMELEEELSGVCEISTMGMGHYGFAAPMKDFERRLLNRDIHHGNNPILRWMADNLAVTMDAAGNLKPNKRESQGKIDGIVAMIMALDLLSRSPEFKSKYEERGLLELEEDIK